MIEGALLLAALLVFLGLLRGASKPGADRANLGFLAYREAPNTPQNRADAPKKGGV